MQIFNSIRVANHNGNLAELLKKYSPDFVRYENKEKYALLSKENGSLLILMASDHKDNPWAIDPSGKYNILISATGNSIEKITQTMGDLEKKLGVKLEPAKHEIYDYFNNIILNKMLSSRIVYPAPETPNRN